ncbi:MAG: DsbA family protein [Pseudomonadota bacterium]|nr:DsbA family protein [Pseudomonadota bacterium]
METLKKIIIITVVTSFFQTTLQTSLVSQEISAESTENNEKSEGLVYKEIIYGDINAPITIFEYASLTCNHCATFHTTVLPKLKTNYIDKSLVKLVYRDYPLDGLAMAGAMLARCAPEGRGKAMLNLLFSQQMTWVTSNTPLEPLKKYSKFAGMNEKEVDSCLKNEEMLNSVRNKAEEANDLYNIKSTPTFFIDGVKIEGNMGYEYMSKIIDEKLSKN